MIKRFNNFLNEDVLDGKRVRLIHMPDDPNPIESGEEGTIKGVDGAGQIMVKWDNGRSLSLIPDVDEYEIIEEGIETVGVVGSGSAVSGYPTGKFVKAAGQNVGGGDSASSFNANSNASEFEGNRSIGPRKRFQEKKKKMTKKDKEERINNQIGADIDQLHKPSKAIKNENIKTFDEFNRLNEKVNKS